MVSPNGLSSIEIVFALLTKVVTVYLWLHGIQVEEPSLKLVFMKVFLMNYRLWAISLYLKIWFYTEFGESLEIYLGISSFCLGYTSGAGISVAGMSETSMSSADMSEAGIFKASMSRATIANASVAVSADASGTAGVGWRASRAEVADTSGFGATSTR